MRKLFTILLIIICTKANAQFSPAILQVTDTPYLNVNRIGTGPYIAALTENGLDIREAGTTDFGTHRQFLSIPDLNTSASMELMGNYACIFNELYDTAIVADLTNPLSPALISGFSLPAYSSVHCHRGSFMYVCSGYKCYIYSFASPAAPVLLDSIDRTMQSIKCSGNNVYTVSSYPTKIYHWLATDTAPYLTLSDSTFISPSISPASIDISGSQLVLMRDPDSLYRFRISSSGTLAPISAEELPGYPYDGNILARDTDILGYVRYNTFCVSKGVGGSSFTDTSRIPVDGNYAIRGGSLDDNLYYTNVLHTYLVSFPGTSGVETVAKHPTFRIYPNPTSNTLTISSNTSSNDLRVDVADMRGTVQLQQTLKGQKDEMDISRLCPGNYVLYFFDGGKKIGEKKVTKL